MESIINDLKILATTYGLQIVGALVTIIIGLWFAKFFSNSIGKILTKRNIDATLSKFVVSVIKIGIIVFVFISAISQVGIQTASFVAVLGAAGLAVGFALQGSLSNLAAGVMLILFRQIKVGDFISGAGELGSIEEIGIFTTKLVTPDNKVIYIPNSSLIGNNITNFSEKETRRVDLVFGIGYGDDIDTARNIINELINADQRIMKDPAPFVAVSELADSSVNFVVRVWTDKADYWGVHFDLTEKVKKSFDAKGVSIPFPQRDVHIYQNTAQN